MTVKYLLLASLCAAFLVNCHSGWTTWVKLNSSPVCFGAKNNKYGAFTYGKNAFIWAFRLDYRSGYVSCSIFGGNSRRSPWGCDPNKPNILTFLTDGRNTVVGPRFSLPINQAHYNLPGYNSSSPYLIFFMGKIPFCVHENTELRLWYGEDLRDQTESDNVGTSCADVYGLTDKQ